MSVISQVKKGEYIITTYDSGHVIKEIDQTGKVTPEAKVEKPVDPMMDINKKLDEILTLLRVKV